MAKRKEEGLTRLEGIIAAAGNDGAESPGSGI